MPEDRTMMDELRETQSLIRQRHGTAKESEIRKDAGVDAKPGSPVSRERLKTTLRSMITWSHYNELTDDRFEQFVDKIIEEARGCYPQHRERKVSLELDIKIWGRIITALEEVEAEYGDVKAKEIADYLSFMLWPILQEGGEHGTG